MRSFLIAFTSVMLVTAGAAQAKVDITIDKDNQQMTVAVDGVARYHWPVSSGIPSRETPNGTFRAFRMEEDHYSKEFDDAPMPHSIFFTKIGHAIHGTDSVSRLGTPASHGCVRLAPGKAATLFALVKAEGMGNTRVVIGGDETALAGRASPRREARRDRLERDGFAQDGLYAPNGLYADAPVARQRRGRSADPWGDAGWQPVGAAYPPAYGGTYYTVVPGY